MATDNPQTPDDHAPAPRRRDARSPSRSTERPGSPETRRTVVRRRVIAVSTIVIVLSLFVGGTVAAVLIAAPRILPPAANVAGTTSAVPSPSSTPELPMPAVSPVPTPSSPSPPFTPPPPAGFDKTQLSIDDPNSYWFVVNKLRPIPDAENFVPNELSDIPSDIPNPNGYQLRLTPLAALAAMFVADKNEVGTQLVAQSGYRDYSVQVKAYQYYVGIDGVAGADKTSARPGFSEHQTGLAMDILDTTSGCTTDFDCFGKTASGKWLAANAYRFGYILRYPADKTAITGYEYEPWHFRYVGTELSTEMHNTGVETLEEFFGLPAAPDYAG
ncbi:M15 family metallopeptidase [Subtercola sp. PAMC28395]|uniref:M15 family metallopeptidase n=1 Tax=Subtercola sp. PAMC28395 TaxID=2846775 RepID=UPI001C0BB4FE|nr:M15 family metallopeptidase [Subtercola sp. PAMC28395]QWT24566.1 M15 family metallopeptidase [Subtercola sp. PAMC28395]